MLNPCDQDFAGRLAAEIPGLSIKPAEPRYLEEPRGKFIGLPTWVAAPSSTEMVARVVRLASDASIGIQPYGGGTGLVGGQIVTEGPEPLILSMEKMRAIRAVYPAENTLIAEAGATLTEIHDAADDANRLFPLSYASQGTAQIGSGLAVNSGGLNVLRYGMARDLCLGVEAVLANGTVFNGLKRLRKDNTGYDIRHLLIGSEGTLGIITAAALSLAPKPARHGTAFLEVAGPKEALELLNAIRESAGDVVSAFELMSGTGLDFLAEVFPDVRRPFRHNPEWTVLVEIGTSEAVDPEEILSDTFESALETGWVTDGLIATSGAQREAFWAVRETIPQANRAIGAVASHDISLPLSELPEFLESMPTRIAGIADVRVNAFGHLGDGNLHYNVFPPAGRSAAEFKSAAPDLSTLIHDEVVRLGGSFSAEHGIGRLKTGELARYGDPAKLSVMKAIKTALDPHGILNPGVVLD